VRPREPELLEPEQSAELARERAAGRAFDDLAEKHVAGVGVVERLPGRSVGLPCVIAKRSCSVRVQWLAPVREHVLDELRIARVVVQRGGGYDPEAICDNAKKLRA